MGLMVLLYSHLPAQPTRDLQFQELSRIHFPSLEIVDSRKPVVRYPYVYLPNSYGFQICLWDSLAGTFTELGNFGVRGKVMEMVALGNDLFLSVDFSNYTDWGADAETLIKVDISVPDAPVKTGSLFAGAGLYRYRNLRVLNGKLLATVEANGVYTHLAVIDPADCSILGLHPGMYRFEVVRQQWLVTRLMNAEAFQLYSVGTTGDLTSIGNLALPYAVNSFPGFFDVGQSVVGTYCGEGFKLWDCSNPLAWTLLSETEQTTDNHPVLCNGNLVYAGYVPATDSTRFWVYSLANPSAPALINTCNYPAGMGIRPSVISMTGYGSFIFHTCLAHGCVCLRLGSSGQINVVDKCYRYNAISARASKYGNLLLQPLLYSGIACFDCSDPQAPFHSFDILPDFSIAAGVCGDYLVGTFRPNDGGTVLDRVYHLSDPRNPVLVYSAPQPMGGYVFFDENQPGAFYRLDNASLRIEKYLLAGDSYSYVCGIDLPVMVQTPAFADGILYAAAQQGAGGWNDLYAFAGFPQNAPQAPLVMDSFLENPGLVYEAGQYLFIRNPSSTAPYSRFYSPAATFMVDNDQYGFDFGQFLAVGRETGISFYNVSGVPGGILQPDYILPQYSASIRMEWDDAFAYVFGVDNISVWSYQISASADEQLPSPATRISCHPNPFLDVVHITGKSATQPPAQLKIYNLRGQLVRRIETARTADTYQASWDGRDARGNILPAGIYIVKDPSSKGTARIVKCQ